MRERNTCACARLKLNKRVRECVLCTYDTGSRRRVHVDIASQCCIKLIFPRPQNEHVRAVSTDINRIYAGTGFFHAMAAVCRQVVLVFDRFEIRAVQNWLNTVFSDYKREICIRLKKQGDPLTPFNGTIFKTIYRLAN